LEEQAEKVFTD